MTPQIPVFVYGTLRPDQGNDRLYVGRADARHDGEATLRRYRMVTNGAFPYVIPDDCPDSRVVGALVYPHRDAYEDVLARMDRLEGVPTHYERRLVNIRVPERTRPIAAWVYVPRNVAAVASLRPVLTGDWTNHVTSRGWD